MMQRAKTGPGSSSSDWDGSSTSRTFLTLHSEPADGKQPNFPAIPPTPAYPRDRRQPCLAAASSRPRHSSLSISRRQSLCRIYPSIEPTRGVRVSRRPLLLCFIQESWGNLFLRLPTRALFGTRTKGGLERWSRRKCEGGGEGGEGKGGR